MGKYKFGYFEADDVIQEARKEAIIALESYDEVRPLENFLSHHIKCRLLNLKRNVFKRVECPCTDCKVYPTKHKDGQYCRKYLEWEKRNNSKQSLCGTAEIFDNHGSETDWDAEIDLKDKIEKIEREIPANLRSYYLKMKAGVFVNKNKRIAVEEFIKGLFTYEATI